ncbi:helix-turn-helix domain-containing protein [Chthonomonas sp.]
MQVTLTYRIALCPTAEQEALLR